MRASKLDSNLLQSQTPHWNSFNFPLNRFFFLFTGLIINTLLIQKLEYTVVAILLFLFGWCATKILYKHALHNLFAYELSFSLILFFSILSNTYLFLLSDPSQVFGDAGVYFREAAGETNLISSRYFIGSIYFYQKIYDFFALFGFEKNMYIGTLANTVIASLSIVYAVKSLNVISPTGKMYCFKITLLMCLSGSFLLFSTTHLRDILVLFLINIVFYLCIDICYKKSNLWTFCIFSSKILLLTILMTFFRFEFIMIPTLLAALACLSKAVVRKEYLYLIIGTVALLPLILIYWGTLFQIGSQASSYYAGLRSGRDDSGGSLYLRYVESQPVPLRGAMGLYFLFYYPIPIFAGNIWNEIYDFYKSSQGIYNYFILPAFLTCVLRFKKYNYSKKPVIFFSGLLVLVIGLAIVFTSGESRHFGVFLLPLIFPIALTDWSHDGTKTVYLQFFTISFLLIYAIHLLWGQLKLF